MYSMSQCSGGCGGGYSSFSSPVMYSSNNSSRLEEITSSYSSSSPATFYSASSMPIAQSYQSNQDISSLVNYEIISTNYLAKQPIRIISDSPLDSSLMSYSNYNSSVNIKQNITQYNNSNILGYNLFKTNINYNFLPNNFIKPGMEGTFVGKAQDIKEHIEDAFRLMFNEEFPNDIKLSVLNEKEFRKIAPHPGTTGLSINRKKWGMVSEIFVLNGSLANVMLTIGHELGHVMTETLGNSHDEEAKAYAFSLAWMDIIKEHNIANLGKAIVLNNPANNGLHDVAFNYIYKIIKRGRSAWSVYLDLIRNNISVNFAS